MRRLAFELANRRGLPLRGEIIAPDDSAPHPVVVVCHGFKGFKDWGFFPHLGERIAGTGNICLLFNFSGSGIGGDLENFTELERFAEDTISGQVEDLGDILDALQSGALAVPKADLKRIGALGHSRGGATVLIRAREDPRLRCVVTWAAVSDLMRYSAQELDEWKRQGYAEFLNTRTQQTMRINYTMVEDLLQNRERFEVTKALAALDIPVLIVHGEEDASVGVQAARDLYGAADKPNCEMRIIPRTGHTFGAVHPWKGTTEALETAIEDTTDWFRNHLGGTIGGSPP